MDGVTSRGEGRGVTSQYAAALLYNGLGRYDQALAAAELVCQYDDIGVLGWSLAELVEAAVRSNQPARASDALRRLSESTRASGTDWALGTEARSRALLSKGQAAENCYREAIERLGRTRMRPAAARARLLYGEWLRRQNRRHDARAELRTAHSLFTTMGIEAFAERARRELLAAGDTTQAGGRDRQRAHRPGSAHRPARRRRPHQCGNRGPAIPQHPDRRMASRQGVHQARRRLTPGAAAGPGQPRPAGLPPASPTPGQPARPPAPRTSDP